ncbi:MAG: response regulator [bacterium]
MAEILWIEDQLERGINQQIGFIREQHPDYSFTVAEDDLKATNLLKERRFDLVILDIRMKPVGGESIVSSNTPPRQVGIRLLEALREGRIEGAKTASDVSVIVLSAIIDESDKKAIMSVTPPPLFYVEKPADLFEFTEAVERSLGKNDRKRI